jgi:phage terminase large subunit GpA-like protein
MLFATPDEALPRVDEAHERLRTLWEPPPDMTISEWADAFRVMPKGTTSRPGPWKTELYQREMMDVFNDPEVHEVVFIKCTQIGYTEILNNIVGYHIHLDPKPILLVQPSLEDAKGFGKKRITPMIQACAPLLERVREKKSREGGNTLLLKEFAGGFLKLTGANSGKGLRSDPVPIVLCDEADAYPDDVDGEGEPIEIALNRTEGYSDFKLLVGSTPAKPKGLDAAVLEKKWLRSDMRRFHVPCPHCGELQALWWRDPKTDEYRLVFEKDENGEVIAESVRYICAGCKRGIPERFKQRMLDHGQWIAEQPGRAIVGFHINALYRPWKDNWAAMAQKWVDAQGDNEALKEFINLQLGEWWDEGGSNALKAEGLMERREQYPQLPGMPPDHARPWEFEMVPAAVGVLLCAADVQENRIEASIKGWGAGEESWLIAHEVFWGDPSSDSGVWEQLEAFRLHEFTHQGGSKIRPLVTFIDSGDNTDAVYDFVQPRQNMNDCVFACKGVPYHSKPSLVQEGTTKRSNIRLFTIDTKAAKDRIFSRLRIIQPGAGYMHFPSWSTQEYFDQLLSEKKIRMKNKRTRISKTVWVKTHTRNEALDLEVYGMGALFALQNILDARFRDLGVIAAAINGQGAVPQSGRGRRVRSRGIS